MLILMVAAVAVSQDTIELKDLVIALLPLLTTFAGATLAFRLNLSREEEKESERRKQALNFALFVLGRQDNAVRRILCDYQLAQNDFVRAFNLPARKPPDYAELKVPIDELAFLLDVGYPQLLFELSVEQERFDQLLDSVRIRNSFYVDEVQPAIERTHLSGKVVTAAEAEHLLGQRIYGAALNQARVALDHLLASSQSIPKVASDLRAAAKGLYPRSAFVSYTARLSDSSPRPTP